MCHGDCRRSLKTLTLLPAFLCVFPLTTCVFLRPFKQSAEITTPIAMVIPCGAAQMLGFSLLGLLKRLQDFSPENERMSPEKMMGLLQTKIRSRNPFFRMVGFIFGTFIRFSFRGGSVDMCGSFCCSQIFFIPNIYYDPGTMDG